MLDMATSASEHGTPSKRIPSSLATMRRQSLANRGKYKLPNVEAGALPENSLVGMAAHGRLSIGVGSLPSSLQDLGSAVSALVTPKKVDNKLTSQALQESLDQASSHLKKKGDLGLPAYGSHSPGGSCTGLVRSFTTNATTQEMDSLLKSGLVTPRRTGRRSISLRTYTAGTTDGGLFNSTHHKKVARLRSKADDGGTNNEPSDAADHSTPESCRRIRRVKSEDENAGNAFLTPRRTARKSAGARLTKIAQQHASNRMDILATPARKGSKSLVLLKPSCSEFHSPCSSASSVLDDVQSFACESIIVKEAPASKKTWLCTCGEENEGGCKFCGMCGTKHRWECANCNYANKCKFQFCGMCGIPKKTASQ
jgi:hypothetical protein